MNNVRVILKDGSRTSLQRWQEIYGITGDGQIGKYFNVREARFQKDIALYGKVVVNELLMRVLDAYRDTLGIPVTINSFNRNAEKQAELREKGLRAANVSPHEAKLAADIDTPGVNDMRTPDHLSTNKEMNGIVEFINRRRVQVLEKISKDLNIRIRIGNEQYLKDGNTFIHVDVCPEYYAPGKPWNSHLHPAPWEYEARW